MGFFHGTKTPERKCIASGRILRGQHHFSRGQLLVSCHESRTRHQLPKSKHGSSRYHTHWALTPNELLQQFLQVKQILQGTYAYLVPSRRHVQQAVERFTEQPTWVFRSEFNTRIRITSVVRKPNTSLSKSNSVPC